MRFTSRQRESWPIQCTFLGAWVLFAVSLLLPAYSPDMGYYCEPATGWDCVRISFMGLPSEAYPATWMGHWIGGYTGVNLMMILSVPLVFVRPIRQSAIALALSLLTTGYTLSWLCYHVWRHHVGDICIGYYVWFASFGLLALGLLLSRRQPDIRGRANLIHRAATEREASGDKVWPPPPTVPLSGRQDG